MRVRLREMGADELPAFIARARESYVRQMIELGGIQENEALGKAETETEQLFPGGRPADDVHPYVIEDDEGGAPVGAAFFATTRAAERNGAFVYGLDIDEPFRGQGLGRAAMLALEQRARELGCCEIRLNVFAGNKPARALYRSLGYEETAVTMAKRLA